jgi:hypothetical protein
MKEMEFDDEMCAIQNIIISYAIIDEFIRVGAHVQPKRLRKFIYYIQLSVFIWICLYYM